jgi:hypothetical protein
MAKYLHHVRSPVGWPGEYLVPAHPVEGGADVFAGGQVSIEEP